MNNDQITALAREYAEEKGNVMEQKQSLPNCLIKEVVEMDATERTCFLQWLSRRYYLVEKECLKKKYAELKSEWRTAKGTDVYTALTKMESFESLFPDVAKEVEE